MRLSLSELVRWVETCEGGAGIETGRGGRPTPFRRRAAGADGGGRTGAGVGGIVGVFITEVEAEALDAAPGMRMVGGGRCSVKTE